MRYALTPFYTSDAMESTFTQAATLAEPKGLVIGVEVDYTTGGLRGNNAPDAWRGLMKRGLCDAYGERYALELLEPSRSGKQGSNSDCPGVLVDSLDKKNGALVTLRFLGTAGARFACACLQSIQIMLTTQQRDYPVQGQIVRLQVLGASGWREIGMPLRGSDLTPHRFPMVDLSEMPKWRTGSDCPSTRLWRLETLSSWLWRSKGLPVKQPPEWADLVNLIAARFERFAAIWSEESSGPALQAWSDSFHHMRALVVHRREAMWKFEHKRVGKKAYSGSGHLGWVNYEGDLDEIAWNCLRLGSYLQVGQQTSIGRGRYTFQPMVPGEIDEWTGGA